MLECLVMLIVWVIVALIVIFVIETLVAQFFPIPPQILMLIRLLVGLLVLIAALDCIGFVSLGWSARWHHPRPIP
jgi:hypothetical protein